MSYVWTDERVKEVRVGGAGGGKVSITDVRIPSSAKPNEWYPVGLSAHVDEGYVRIAMAIENARGNPSYIEIRCEGRVYRINPGYMLVFYVGRPYGVCTTARIAPSEILFPKEGDYKIVFHAGYIE